MRVGRRVNPRKKVDNHVVMRLVIAITVLFLGAISLNAQSSSAPAGARTTEDVVHEGELETYVASGGESTGWRLRMRTAEGRRQYVELLLTAEMARGARANARVRVRGVMRTLHYVERGDVQALAVKEMIEVARR